MSIPFFIPSTVNSVITKQELMVKTIRNRSQVVEDISRTDSEFIEIKSPDYNLGK